MSPFAHLQFNSVQFSHSVMSDSLWPHELQHARPPCPLPTPGVCSNSCPLSRWYHPAISSSVVPFSCSQFFAASGYFPVSWLSYQVAKVWELQFQHQSFQWIFKVDFFRTEWFDLLAVRRTLNSIHSTTVQKHQFFCTQLSSQFNSHIHTWLLEKPLPWLDRPLLAK